MKTYAELRAEAEAKSPRRLVRRSPNINFMIRAMRDLNSPQNPRNQAARGKLNP